MAKADVGAEIAAISRVYAISSGEYKIDKEEDGGRVLGKKSDSDEGQEHDPDSDQHNYERDVEDQSGPQVFMKAEVVYQCKI